MRIEKSFRHLGPRVPADLRSLRGGARALRRFHQGRIHRSRARGRRGAARRQAAARDLRCRPTDADAIGDEPIWHDGKVVGWVTSGGYGHSVGQSIALGYVGVAHANATEGFAVEIIGERRPAVRLPQPPFDPSGTRMRS